ncbi:DUF3800 domain-containing protein [Flavobacterium sp. WC2430]|uniref:DUF3800 domain-containing protein n=1 Tax=Flavobacterium sp. WC2430 TaxID=3234137 RepID=UPI00346592BB
MKHLIVIDDTSSPGNFNESKFLKENRKTLVGVFIHSDLREDLENCIKGIILILNSAFGINEIHMTDLVNKKNEYSNLTNEEVIEIIEQISDLISRLELPYFVQTIHNDTLEENGIEVKGKVIIDKLDLNKNEDNCLILLTIKIKEYLKENYPNTNIEIVMDEGRKKANYTEQFEILKNITDDNLIEYKSSKDYPLLQIADYFAYSINRMQTTLVKDKRTEFDKFVVENISFALSEQVGIGVTKKEIDIDDYTKEDYDNDQLMKREKDGNLELWEKVQRKRENNSSKTK